MASADPKLATRPAHVLEDPSAVAVARVYAEAFLGAAETAGVESALEELGSFVDDVLAAHPEFESILSSGIVGRDEKVALIDRVVAPRASELLANFLRVLARHDRLELLPLIRSESRQEHERRTGRRRVQVVSARPLPDDARERVRRELTETLPFQPILEERVDASLLGGLIIQIGDTVYDTSLRSRMNQLQAKLRERTIHEIQSGRDRFRHPEGD